MKTIYTFGYGGATPDDLMTHVKERRAIVVDVRYSPRSRNPDWSRKRLTERFGGRYMHVKTLGNKNFKGGPIKLHDPESAVEELAPILEKVNVILICVCKDVDKCHRKDAAEVLAEALGAEIVHLPGKGQRQPRLL